MANIFKFMLPIMKNTSAESITLAIIEWLNDNYNTNYGISDIEAFSDSIASSNSLLETAYYKDPDKGTIYAYRFTVPDSEHPNFTLWSTEIVYLQNRLSIALSRELTRLDCFGDMTSFPKPQKLKNYLWNCQLLTNDKGIPLGKQHITLNRNILGILWKLYKNRQAPLLPIIFVSSEFATSEIVKNLKRWLGTYVHIIVFNDMQKKELESAINPSKLHTSTALDKPILTNGLTISFPALGILKSFPKASIENDFERICSFIYQMSLQNSSFQDSSWDEIYQINRLSKIDKHTSCNETKKNNIYINDDVSYCQLDKHFAEEIKHKRKELKLKQKDLANDTNSYSFIIDMIEKKHITKINTSFLRDIKRALSL